MLKSAPSEKLSFVFQAAEAPVPDFEAMTDGEVEQAVLTVLRRVSDEAFLGRHGHHDAVLEAIRWYDRPRSVSSGSGGR